MAGIYVSGGTYSGSGDLTADWVQVEDSSTFYAPDGTFKLVGAGTPAGASYQLWYENNAIIYHQSGTTLFAGTSIGTSFIRDASYDTYSREYPFYNVILDDSSNSGISQAVLPFWIENDLTVKANRTLETMTNDYIKALGNVLITGTSSKIDTNHATQGNTQEFGSLHIAAGGTYDATSGTTIINWSDSRSSIWDQRIYKNDGTMIHNSGTFLLNPDTDPVFGGGTGSGGLWNVIATEDGGTPTYRVYDTPIIENDLTVSGALTYGNNVGGGKNHTVSGNVVVISGASYANTGGTANTQSFGSLYIDDTATFIASPAGNLNLYYTSSGFSLNNEGTFTHNDGTVLIDFENGGAPGSARTGYNSDSKVRCASGDLYNLEVEMNRNADATKLYPPAGSENMIENDLTITKGTFYKYNDNYTLIVSGAVTTAASSTFGLASATANDTIGEISNTGTYNATKGTTILKGDFTQAGTFIHNSGTVEIAARCELKPYNYTRPYGDPLTFYDVTHTAGTFYLERPVVFESSYTKTGGDLIHYAEATFGTADAAGTMTINAGEWKLYGYYDDPVLMGASEIYPAIITGSVSDPINWDTVDSITRDTYNYLKWIDVKKDAVTGGGTTSGARFVLSGNCQFAGLEISTKDDFNVNGFRAEFSGALNITGNMVTSGSLMILDKEMNYDGEGWLGNETTDIMITGTGATHDFAGQPYQHIMFNGTGEDKLNWANNFPDTPIIVAGGTFKPDFNLTAGNISIANGGTWNNDVDVLTLSSGKSFSNRGGFFTSSSALSFDETQQDEKVAIPDAISLDLTTAATLMAWVKIPTDAGSKQRVISKSYQAYEMSVESGRLSAYFGTDGAGGFTSVFSPAGVNYRDGKWHHFAITLDGSSSLVKLYVDGKLVQQETSAVNFQNKSSDLSIGFRSDGNTVTNDSWMDGEIVVASVWNTVLTGAGIRESLFYDWAAVSGSSIDQTKCVGWYQFNEGEGTSVSDMSGSGNTGTIENAPWATGGTWTAGGTLSSSAGNLYIGSHTTTPTVFGSSYFTLGNRKLISGSKFASKAHEGTDFYYVATSGTNDYMNYSNLSGAPIASSNDLHILANSYFGFDSDANNNQCDEITNYAGSTVRIVKNADFYTQDFDNQGTWLRNATYDGIIHDDGSTPHEYEPIDIMDDQDSPFDAEDLID